MYAYPTKIKEKPSENLAPRENNTLPMAYRPIFTSIESRVAKAPFEEKLATVLQGMEVGDKLFVSSSISKINEAIKKSCNDFLAPITRVLTMQVPEIDESVAFMKNGKNVGMLNYDDELIPIAGFGFLSSDCLANGIEGFSVLLSGKWYQIKQEPNPDMNLEKYMSMFVKIYDYKDEAKHCIDIHNNRVLSEILSGKQEKTPKTLSFASVGGQDENIDILKKNVLYPMKYPEVFENFMLNRGVILAGPPGTGKTLLAKVLVAESGASSFELCATDLSAKYVGESEKNCRELFEKAVAAQPSIIYFDEFDALAKSRGSVDVYGDKLLNQLLSLMSDIEKRRDNVFVIASTNRKDSLDPAILRSGRFGLQLEIKAPDLAGTKQILKIHTKGKPLDEKLDMNNLAEKMFDKKMTGVEIADVVKIAYTNALERCGIYKSMEEQRFSPMMLEYLSITEEDFSKALQGFKTDNRRKPIGFN